MTHAQLHLLGAAIALGFPLLSFAQTAQDPPPGDVSFRLGRVEVTGRASGPLDSRRLLTSVDMVGGAALQDAPVRNAFELFSRMPGVLLTDFNQGATSGKSNSNDGNMPYLDMVFPLEIERVTTVRGTNDAPYGLHNIAGNIDVATRQGGNATEARLGAGAEACRTCNSPATSNRATGPSTASSADAAAMATATTRPRNA